MSAWGSQSLVRKGVYLVVGRRRPETSPNDPNEWTFPGKGDWQMHSFPAGHFANAMACATYWNNRFHLGVAGYAAYGLAAAVGVGRLADRGHWTSDTVIGGILGYAVGKEIARRSLRRKTTLHCGRRCTSRPTWPAASTWDFAGPSRASDFGRERPRSAPVAPARHGRCRRSC